MCYPRRQYKYERITGQFPAMRALAELPAFDDYFEASVRGEPSYDIVISTATTNPLGFSGTGTVNVATMPTWDFIDDPQLFMLAPSHSMRKELA